MTREYIQKSKLSAIFPIVSTSWQPCSCFSGRNRERENELWGSEFILVCPTSSADTWHVYYNIVSCCSMCTYILPHTTVSDSRPHSAHLMRDRVLCLRTCELLDDYISNEKKALQHIICIHICCNMTHLQHMYTIYVYGMVYGASRIIIVWWHSKRKHFNTFLLCSKGLLATQTLVWLSLAR